jgi:hypothetical protein
MKGIGRLVGGSVVDDDDLEVLEGRGNTLSTAPAT